MAGSLARIAADALRPGRTVRWADHPGGIAELHLPRGAGPHPVVVLVHGGSWRDGFDRRVTRPLAHDLRRRGWAAWNVEYRRIGRSGGGWPATFDDVAAAVDTLADVDAPLDLERVVLLGHSAGGQLALWAAGRDGLPAGAPGERPRVHPRAVVATAPVTDLERLGGLTAPGGLVHRLLGGGPAEVPERYALTSPIRRVPLRMPALLVHGAEDRTVSVGQSRRYAQEGPGRRCARRARRARRGAPRPCRPAQRRVGGRDRAAPGARRRLSAHGYAAPS